MEKQQIIEMILSIATQNGGRAPGIRKFESLTGIGKPGWYPKFWLRWSDAIREAGCQPNTMDRSFDKEVLIKKYIVLIRELQRFPIEGELRIKRTKDKTFPSDGAFKSLGGKSVRAAQIVEYCLTHEGFEDIIPICSEFASTEAINLDDGVSEIQPVGYVYLFQHGPRREYKIGKTNNPIRREGEISIELPEKVKPIRVIKTDDPSGVELYWHRRFKDKAMNVE